VGAAATEVGAAASMEVGVAASTEAGSTGKDFMEADSMARVFTADSMAIMKTSIIMMDRFLSLALAWGSSPDTGGTATTIRIPTTAPVRGGFPRAVITSRAGKTLTLASGMPFRFRMDIGKAFRAISLNAQVKGINLRKGLGFVCVWPFWGTT
jgi:hypothetical protein